MINQQTIQFIIFFSFLLFTMPFLFHHRIGMFFFGCFWWNSSIFLPHSYTHTPHIHKWFNGDDDDITDEWFFQFNLFLLDYYLLNSLDFDPNLLGRVCVCVYLNATVFFIGCKKPPWSQILNNTTDLTQNFSRVTEYNVLQFKQT